TASPYRRERSRIQPTVGADRSSPGYHVLASVHLALRSTAQDTLIIIALDSPRIGKTFSHACVARWRLAGLLSLRVRTSLAPAALPENLLAPVRALVHHPRGGLLVGSRSRTCPAT